MSPETALHGDSAAKTIKEDVANALRSTKAVLFLTFFDLFWLKVSRC